MRRAVALNLALLALAVVSIACGSENGPSATPSLSSTLSTPAPSPGAASSTAALVERLRPTVVHILSEAATLDVFGQVAPSRGVGTGFIIDGQGHIVTNNHVVTLSVRPELVEGHRFIPFCPCTCHREPEV